MDRCGTGNTSYPYLKILIGNRDDKVKEGTTNLLLYRVFHMEIDSSVEKEH